MQEEKPVPENFQREWDFADDFHYWTVYHGDCGGSGEWESVESGEFATLPSVPCGLDFEKNKYFTKVDWDGKMKWDPFTICIREDIIFLVRNIHRTFLKTQDYWSLAHTDTGLKFRYEFLPLCLRIPPELGKANGWTREEIENWTFEFEISVRDIILWVIPPTGNEHDRFFWKLDEHPTFEAGGRNEVNDIIDSLKYHNNRIALIKKDTNKNIYDDETDS